jgi:hypothetical protein
MLCTTTFTLAQSTDATISGEVVDTSGKIITDADIEILNEATRMHYSGKTNGAGIYTVSILPPGQYLVQVSKAGFKTLIKPGITLNVQSALALNFTLPVGATSESVSVEAGTSTINTTDASVSTVIDRKFVENTPLNGRSFQDLISMTPGVTTQSPQAGSANQDEGDFSVNGQRTESNYYTVDGVDANIGAGDGRGYDSPGNGGTLPGSTALGTTQSLLSLDALQEFRVQSSTYSAEYGRSPGGQLSFVTRSGTNGLHGSAYNYLRNDVFDSNDWFNDHYGVPRTALRQNDFGGTFGGPILVPKLYDGRSKTFFFVSYEGLRLIQPQAATIQYVPDTALRQQAPPALQSILNAYPLPSSNGVVYASSGLAQFIEPFSLPSQIDSTSVRVDHSVSQKLSLFFRFGYTPSSTDARVLSAKTQLNMNAETDTFGATCQFARAVNEFRFGYTASNTTKTASLDSFGNAQSTDLAGAMGAAGYTNPSLYFGLDVSGVGNSDLTLAPGRNAQQLLNLIDATTTTVGSHQLKFGIDYLRIAPPISPPSLYELADFTAENSILQNSSNLLFLAKYASSTPLFHDFSAYVQDEWRIRKYLSLSLGVRWEVDPPPTEANGNDAYTVLGNLGEPSSLTLAPRGTPLWKTSWNNFAPRLGVAWTTHNKGRWETVFRAGVGVYFDSNNENATTGFSALGFNADTFFFGAPVPATKSETGFPIMVSPPYTSSAVVAYPAHLQLPYTLQWNTSLQQTLGKSQSLTLTYIGENGRRLSAYEDLSISAYNPNFSNIYYFPSNLTSSYNGLQVQFQRTVSRGVQLLASYTWAHSIDFGSNSSTLPESRGNSDFDVRDNFQAGISWEIPAGGKPGIIRMLSGGWAIDGRFISRTAFPITLQGLYETDPTTGSQFYTNLDLVPNQPISLHGSEYPGRKALNPSAFAYPTGTELGDAPRNYVRGFGEVQTNAAIRREFRLHDSLALQFRAESFNVFNHPNFGYVDPTLSDATFGLAKKTLGESLGTLSSLYQQGGPRSMQFTARIVF